MELFKAKLGSPVTQLAENITNTQTTISLVNADVLPDAPNIATIGTGVNAETVRYSGKTLNTLTGITRGFTGAAKAWESGQSIARIFTQYDHDSSVNNIQTLEGGTAGQVLSKLTGDDYSFVWVAGGGGGGGGSAAEITYDNTTSGLTAIDVQAAIDEIDATSVEVANNLTTTVAGKALDATQGKIINDGLVAHKAESATRSNLGHVNLPEGWKTATLLNGWSVGEPIGYFKDAFGDVRCKGVMVGGAITDGTVIFNLPAGYRPVSPVRVNIVNHVATIVDIYNSFAGIGSNGDVKIYGVKTNEILDVSGIAFSTN